MKCFSFAILLLLLTACRSEVRNMDDPALSNPNNEVNDTTASDSSSRIND